MKCILFGCCEGGSATIGGVHPRVLPTQEDATLDLKAIESAIRPTNDPHQPLTRLVCLGSEMKSTRSHTHTHNDLILVC